MENTSVIFRIREIVYQRIYVRKFMKKNWNQEIVYSLLYEFSVFSDSGRSDEGLGRLYIDKIHV